MIHSVYMKTATIILSSAALLLLASCAEKATTGRVPIRPVSSESQKGWAGTGSTPGAGGALGGALNNINNQLSGGSSVGGSVGGIGR